MVISMNGVILSPGEANISLLDRGFLFGDSLFETILGINGRLIHPEKHLARLREGASYTKIPLPRDEELIFDLQHCLETIGKPKVQLRLMITRGEGLGLLPQANIKPNRVIYAFEPSPVPSSWLEEGIKLLPRSLPYTDRSIRFKTTQYLPSIVGLLEAKEQNFDEILWVNHSGEITESSTANIFFIERDGDQSILKTPSLSSGLLGGVTRQVILEMIETEETTIYLDELARFDEAFLSSSVRGLIPIRQIGQKKFSTPKKTSYFWKIKGIYEQHSRIL